MNLRCVEARSASRVFSAVPFPLRVFYFVSKFFLNSYFAIHARTSRLHHRNVEGRIQSSGLYVERKMLRMVKQQKYSFLDIISFSYVYARAGVYSVSGLFHAHSD
jgi:hypothetical protein